MSLRYAIPNLADAGRESKAVEAWEAGLANKKNPAGCGGIEGSRHKKQPEFNWKKKCHIHIIMYI